MTSASDAFSIDTLTDVFKAWRKPCELADLPPSRSCIVRERCARDGIAPDTALRSLLVVALTEGVEARRAALGIRLIDHKGVPATWLVTDIQSGDQELQAWGALYHRYVKGHRAGELAVVSGYDRKTIRRYEEKGFALLAAQFQCIEDACQAARHRPAEGWHEARAAVLRAIREDGTWTEAPFDEAQLDAWRPTPAEDLTEYLADRVVLGSLRTRVPRGVVPTLIVYQDQGAHGRGARWRAEPCAYTGLDDVLDGVAAPAVALLGPPGSGKTTLLARLEHDAAVDALRQKGLPIPWYVPLGEYAAPHAGAEPPPPLAWIAARWDRRFPALPLLPDLIAKGRMLFLLDGLNEMPHADAAERRLRLDAWRAFVRDVVAAHTGNRAVFACRSLDYSSSLSADGATVPQVAIQPLDDDEMRALLAVLAPAQAGPLWEHLVRSGQVDLFRLPYELALLIDHILDGGDPEAGTAALFTTMVHRALRREVEQRHNPRFEPGELMSDRDTERVVQVVHWTDPYALPEEGALFPSLSRMAYDMQAGRGGTEAAQVRVPHAEAVRRAHADPALARRVLACAFDLGFLLDDRAANEVLFVHQMVQEYFAARQLAAHPEPERLRLPAAAAEVVPDLASVLASLAPADPLPPAPGTVWDQTAPLAAVMAGDADAFLAPIRGLNPILAARCAAQPACAASEALKDGLRADLLRLMGDDAIDLRVRIAAGHALGDLGDPRFERRRGPHGDYLLPPFVAIPGGDYPIGSDGSIYPEEAPVHVVRLAGFSIARFPVTYAEWALFMASGGYEDERWWTTDGARRWRMGEGTAAGWRQNVRSVVARYRADPELFERHSRSGNLNPAYQEEMRRFLAMDDAALEGHLNATAVDTPRRSPRYWRDPTFRSLSSPVNGITWYEARAYCAWLSAQSDLPIRLPTEAEWEAAARGTASRTFPYGDAYDPTACNGAESHIRRTTPVGLFPHGETPEGVADLCGNVFEWTSSVYGEDLPYPFDARDGREALEVEPIPRRVQRGGSYAYDEADLRAACRYGIHEASQSPNDGVRLVVGG